MSARKGPSFGPYIAVAVIVLALMCWGTVFKAVKADCEERGGHVEILWGSRVGWTCDGARR